MGKIKLHEIAKKIGVNSKEVIEKAIELGLDVKSHMSTVDESDAKKIEAKFSGVKKEVKEKKEEPVIIRRAVIVSEDETEKLKHEKKVEKTNNRDVGFIERERKTDYNIVYRNKPNKPMTVSELFGKKTTPEKPKTEVKPEVKPKQTIETVEEKPPVAVEKTGEQTERRNNNFAPQSRPYNNGNRPFNRDGYNNNRPYNNGSRSFDRDSQNNGNRPFNRNGQNGRSFNKEGYNNNRQFNRNGQGQSGFGRRPLDEKGIEKNIKNIMSADIVEKESVREYANKVIDKQKNNRYEEKTNKKASKSRRGGYEEISSHKLKDLKQQDRLSNMFDEGSMLDYYDLTTTRGRRGKKKLSQNEDRVKQKIFDLTDITIPESITVKDLSAELKKTSSEIIKKLLGYGIMATINNEVDFDTAFLIAEEFGVTAHKKEVVTDEDILFDESEDKEEELKARPPVIVVMGHVDHGKTSLLDAVRETNVIEGEAGGITQAIGAYQVEVNGREITFLDTPGHEAFTAMRARGAQITDIAILVVAANDGVMPQTVEAINHAKAAGIPIIVAINKIDVEGANPDKVKQELAEYELVSEEWGGDTIFVPISAKKRINIDSLLEMVLLVADMKELKANPKKQAKGTVIEAKLDKAKGPVATMLVQRGTLDVGDTILVGSVIGRIRTMTDDKGHKVKKAGPSTPVEITGLTSVPEAGETFYEVKDEKTAKHLMERRKRQAREKALNVSSRVTLDDLFSQIEKGNLKQLNIIVKADVQGSVEAVKQSLEKLSNDEVRVKVIHANVGAVTESDVTLANVSNAIIIGFNVRPEPIAKDMAEKSEVEIKTYSVIYNAIEDVEAAMKGMLDPVFKEV
ncbi:MAG: translation initiation factor IF-2, partial [Clostridia bacterium]|nr:translation initiation factor IF-2 [Clostridia bacterium]